MPTSRGAGVILTFNKEKIILGDLILFFFHHRFNSTEFGGKFQQMSNDAGSSSILYRKLSVP